MGNDGGQQLLVVMPVPWWGSGINTPSQVLDLVVDNMCDVVGHVHCSDGLMVCWWVVFGKVICQFLLARTPQDLEMLSFNAVLNPEISHVNCL